MRNRNSIGPAKLAERQTRIAGKRPYHRVPKLLKGQIKLMANLARKIQK